MTNGSNEPAGYGQINFSVVVSHQHLAKKVTEKNVTAQWILRWQSELAGPLWSVGISLQHPCECLSRCAVPTTPSTGRSSTDANPINQERVNRDETECCVPAVFYTDLLINAFVCHFFEVQHNVNHQSIFTHKRVCEKNNRKGIYILDRCIRWAVCTVKKNMTLKESRHPMSHPKVSQSTLHNHRENKLVPPEQYRVTAARKTSPVWRKLERTSSLEWQSHLLWQVRVKRKIEKQKERERDWSSQSGRQASELQII